MTNRKKRAKSIIELLEDDKAMQNAFRLAFEDAVRRHRCANVPMVFWENGRVVEVPADQIPLDDDYSVENR